MPDARPVAPDTEATGASSEDGIESQAQAAMLALIEAAATLADAYKVARYLASTEWLGVASRIRNSLIVDARRRFPEDTYQDTAARLGTSVATVNRAISEHNRRVADEA